MITRTFSFLERMGKGTEKLLNKQGIRTWDDFLEAESVAGIADTKKRYFDRKIIEAKHHLYNFRPEFFAENLPSSEHWRLYGHFRDDCCFLDIETTGLSRHDSITVIGLFDGIDTKTMIRDVNLDYAALKEELKRYKILVTFNGSSFDVPFIKRSIPCIELNIPNFDLRFACRRLGMTGGLKTIEKGFGIKRRKLVGDISGGDAVLLWKMYKATGDEHYLKLLVEYNEEDVINLKKIADYAYKELSAIE